MAGIAVATVLLLSACQGSGTPDGGSASGNTTTPLEKVRVGVPGPVVTLDGSVAGDATSMNGIYLTSGQLTRFNADRKPVLDLAESITTADNGRSATVKLRPGLKYSDGTPIVAEDLRYAYQRNLKGTGAAFVSTIKSIKVVDDRTATVNLKGPDPDLESWFAERALQLHPNKLVESDQNYWRHPVSGGPYMVAKNWTPGADVFTAVQNPNYAKGPMMVKTVELVSSPDANSRILQLTSGQLGAAVDLPLSSIGSFPKEVKISKAGVGGSNYLVANETKGGPLADKRVRQAMSYAIDRKTISQKAFFGLQPASTSPMFDCGDLCQRHLLPGDGAQDLARARQLMAAAGFPNGFSTDLKVSNSRGGWQDAAVMVAGDLAKIGIKAKVTPVDEGQHYSSITKQNFELFFTGGGGHHQSTLSQMFNKGDFWVAATGWKPPAEAAAVMGVTATEKDPAKRRAAYTQAQQIWMDAMQVIPVTERIQLNGSRIAEKIFVTQVANDQKIQFQTVAEAKRGVRAGDL